MTLFSKLLAFSAVLMLLAAILSVAFGQITVRKLRKNPTTKDVLGFEFVSGWDILNVAGSLSTPKWLREKFAASPLSHLTANYQALYENTSKFDRIFGKGILDFLCALCFFNVGIYWVERYRSAWLIICRCDGCSRR